MSNVSVIHLTVDCHVWTVCSDGFDNIDTSIQLMCIILLLLVFLGTKVDRRVKSCSAGSGYGKLFNYDKPGKLLCHKLRVLSSWGGEWCFLLIKCVVYVQRECNTSNCGMPCMDCLF